MDMLTDEERILAWKASWHPSFDGVAIVNKDFTFKSVNPQFCELLGVTPADLIGNRFSDVTPSGIRELDEKNAKMVIDGTIDFYVLPKRYQFANGHKADVVLLVTRCPPSDEGDFQFFLSRIMLDESGELLKSTHAELEQLSSPQKKSESMVGAFLKQNIKELIAIGAIIGGVLIALWERFIE